MAFTWWFGVKHSPGGLGTFHAMVNCAVHTVMYFYYAISALGPEYRHLIWWKKYLTTFQMVSHYSRTWLNQGNDSLRKCSLQARNRSLWKRHHNINFLINFRLKALYGILMTSYVFIQLWFDQFFCIMLFTVHSRVLGVSGSEKSWSCFYPRRCSFVRRFRIYPSKIRIWSIYSRNRPKNSETLCHNSQILNGDRQTKTDSSIVFSLCKLLTKLFSD